MKKTLFSALGLALVGLSSCNSDKEEHFTISFDTKAINIVTSLASDEVSASMGTYNATLDYGTSKGKITSSDLKIDDSVFTLSTPEVQFAHNNYIGASIFTKTGGSATSNRSYQITEDLFVTTPLYYYTIANAGDYTYKPTLMSDPNGNRFAVPVMVASYQLGDEYLVRTFQQDTFFGGTTNTEYEAGGQTNTYTTKDIGYRIHINNDLKTATLIMYNAKFSSNEREPVKEAIIAEGLTVTFGIDKITIEGSDIIPLMVEGEVTTPVPSFMFNSISFETISPALTDCKLNYQVAGIYFGSFEGMYIY